MPDTAFIEMKFPYDVDRDELQRCLTQYCMDNWANGVTTSVIMIVPEATEIPANAP